MASLPERLQKARLTLLLDFPFFGQLALRLKPEIRPGAQTAWTDGRIIAFDPDFCAQLSDPELVWLYAHEVGHPALGHIFRLKGRDPERWNIAADYKVNQMLESVINGKPGAKLRMKRIDGTLLDAQFDSHSTEEVYAKLPDPKGGGGSGRGNPQPAPGKQIGDFEQPVGSDAPGRPPVGSDALGRPQVGSDSQADRQPSSADHSQLEREWQIAVAQAVTTERMRTQGKLPAGMELAIRELLEPAVPWQDVLRQFASRVTRDDYSWTRPNRRHVARGFMLPTLRSEGLGLLVVAFDTSGSIAGDPELLRAFLSELQGILDTCHPEKIVVLDCDARVHRMVEYHPGDDISRHVPLGGGGTAFEPVFDYVAEHGIDPSALLYFTDLYGSFPSHEPLYPTLWLNYDSPSNKAPFGQTLNVN